MHQHQRGAAEAGQLLAEVRRHVGDLRARSSPRSGRTGRLRRRLPPRRGPVKWGCAGARVSSSQGPSESGRCAADQTTPTAPGHARRPPFPAYTARTAAWTHELPACGVPLRRHAVPPRAGAAASTCPRSASASGTTSVTTCRSSASGRSCARAFDLGVTHFDLANNYGPPYGAAEENFGRHLRRRLPRPTATSWSSRARPAGTCGRGRTARAAARRKYLARQPRPVAAADGPGLRRHLLPPPPGPDDAARGDDGRARRRRPLGQGAVRRHLVVLARGHRARPPGSSPTWARRC